MKFAFALNIALALTVSSTFLPGSLCLAKDDDDELLKDLTGGSSSSSEKAKEQPAVQTLKAVSSEDFAASRAPFKGRPKPDGLNFNEAAVAKYISSLPQALQKGESDRYANVKKVKDYLIAIFERNQYEGGGLLVKGGPGGKPMKRNLMVTMANDKFLVTKAFQQSKPARFGWSDLDFEQYPQFFEYFIGKKISVTVANVGKDEIAKCIAKDYLLLAMLCDWYGRYDEALDYAKKSIESYPKIERLANNLLMVEQK